ncbi:MAG: hypothetical protein ABEJ89_02950 [Haloarculaceae archaeon]
MSSAETSLRGVGVAVGVPLAAAVWLVAGSLAGVDGGTPIAYGAGAGVVIGAFLGTVERRSRGRDGAQARLAGAGLLVGGAVGCVVGALDAWSRDAAMLDGAALGVITGAVVGVLLAGVMLSVERRVLDG